MAYIYNADLLCDSCGNKTKRELGEAVNVDCRSCKWKGPVTKALLDTENNAGWMECPVCELQTVAFDEYSYDSDEYPKYVDDDSLESDSPDHCSDCGEFLGNALTAGGLAYVRDAIASSNTGIAWTQWKPFYGIKTECSECDKPLASNLIRSGKTLCKDCDNE